MAEEQESKDALKATGTVAGGQIINIIIGLIRVKFVAVILGPSGVGIVGLLTTALDMIRNITGLGLPFSGVRDISQASAQQEQSEVAKIVKVFNLWIFITAILGMVLAIALCIPISRYLFNNDNYATGIVFLSISIFFTAVASGWSAVMQGRRAIGLMVKSSLIANIASSIITTIVYLTVKEKGIIPAFIIISLVNLTVTYTFYKKLNLPSFGPLSFKDSWFSAKGMIRVGIFTIVVTSFDQLMSLGVRAFISDQAGVEGVGLFTAANTIASFYLSIVLSSMASDYYPKLAAIQHDNIALNKSINTQLNIILLLASPIIIGMVGFGDIAIKLFYSAKFTDAVPILKWQILGDFFKIIAWPCSYVFLAKGLGKLYVGYSITYTIINVAIIYFGWSSIGFISIGISFFISQLLALIFTYTYSYFKFGLYIIKSNIFLVILGAIALIITFLAHEFAIGLAKYLLPGMVLLTASCFSLYKLNAIIDINSKIRGLIKR